MAVDPRIAMSFQAPQIASPMDLAQNAFALKGAMQQNALAEAKMAEMQRQQQSQNALRQLFAGGKMPDAAAVYAVDPALGAEFEQRRAEIGRAEAAAAASDAERAGRLYKNQSEMWADFHNLISGAVDEASYQQNLAIARARKFDVSTAPPHFDPNWVANAGRAVLTVKERSEEADRAAGRKISQEQLDVSRGQLGVAQGNLKVAQDRLAFDQSKLGTGATELAPKDRQKRDAAFPQASAALRSSVQEIDTLKADLLALKAHPGLAGITGGIEGRLPSIKGSSSAAQAKLDKILARGQFRELQNLRNSSPTGAAVGNVSDKEGQALRASFAALDQRQDLSDFQAAIDDAVSQLDFAKGNISQAYDDTYSYRQGAAPAGAPAPAPAANANTVTTPDGKVLTFPSAEAAAAFKKAAGLQ